MVDMENDPQRATPVFNYPDEPGGSSVSHTYFQEQPLPTTGAHVTLPPPPPNHPSEQLPLVHTDPHTDPFPRLRPAHPSNGHRPPPWKVILPAAAVAIVLAAAFIGYVVTRPSAPPPVAAAQPFDICAVTAVSASERAALVYTDKRYLSAGVEATSDPDSLTPWCVFTTNYASGLYWGAVYVGTTNPLYIAMTAESGNTDSAPRAVLSYQTVPPVKFARSGWIAFVTPSTTDPTSASEWTAGDAALAAKKLADIAQRAAAPVR